MILTAIFCFVRRTKTSITETSTTDENRRIAHTEFSPAFDAARTKRVIPVMH